MDVSSTGREKKRNEWVEVSSDSRFCEFHRKGLMVDRICPADACGRERGTEHGKGRGCKTRNEVEEARDH